MGMNYLAVLVAALAAMIIGYLWYSPLGFQKSWMKLSGAPKKKPKRNEMIGQLIGGFVTYFIMAGVLSALIVYMGKSIETGVITALICWLGFIGTVSFGNVLWGKKPINLWVLNNAYNLVVLVVMGLIIGAW